MKTNLDANHKLKKKNSVSNAFAGGWIFCSLLAGVARYFTVVISYLLLVAQDFLLIVGCFLPAACYFIFVACYILLAICYF